MHNIPEHVSHRYIVKMLRDTEERIKRVVIGAMFVIGTLTVVAGALTAITVANAAPAEPKTWGVTEAVTIGHPKCKDTNTFNTNGMLLPGNCYLAL